jgi:hypothetical protein
MRDDTSLFSFLIGGLTGAALAALFLPRSGAEARHALRQGVRSRRGRAAAWRSPKASDDRAAGDVLRDRVPEPALPSTTTLVERQV